MTRPGTTNDPLPLDPFEFAFIDYEKANWFTRRLLATIDRLEGLLRESLPHVQSMAEAVRMLDGFEPQEHEEDVLAARINATLRPEARNP